MKTPKEIELEEEAIVILSRLAAIIYSSTPENFGGHDEWKHKVVKESVDVAQMIVEECKRRIIR